MTKSKENQSNNNQKDDLDKLNNYLTKDDKHPIWVRAIDWILLLAILTLVIIAQIQGGLIHRDYVHVLEVCEKEPTNNTQVQYLESIGAITKWNTTSNKTTNLTFPTNSDGYNEEP